MQSLKIKFGLCMLVEGFLLFGCDKETDIPNTKIYQTETTLEIEVRDKRNTGAYHDYWGYVFKFRERSQLSDTIIPVLKYQASTNTIVSHKIPFEYLIYQTKYSSSMNNNSVRYEFFATPDSNYFPYINSHLANQELGSITPKKTNKIYAEFK